MLFGTYLILTRTRGVKLLKLLFIYVFLDYLLPKNYKLKKKVKVDWVMSMYRQKSGSLTRFQFFFVREHF